VVSGAIGAAGGLPRDGCSRCASGAVRHAYTRTSEQGAGVGSALVEHLRQQTDRPLLVGTWKRRHGRSVYERRGFGGVRRGEAAAAQALLAVPSARSRNRSCCARASYSVRGE